MGEVVFAVDSKSLASVKDTVITANFDECKASLIEMMAPYAGLVVTEDTMTAAKADRARINKVAANIDDARKMVKKAYSAPLAEFEAKCKELTGICTTAAKNIDDQVKAFDEKRKYEKLNTLADYLNEQVGELRGYVSWGNILNPKWGNATYSLDKAKEDIDAAIAKCRNDIDTITAMGSKYEPELLEQYKKTQDITATIRKNAELTEVERRLEMQRQKAEEERAAREAARQAEQVKQAAAPAPEVPAPAEAEVPASAGEEIRDITFTCYGTKNQLLMLAQYMKQNGIRFKRFGF